MQIEVIAKYAHGTPVFVPKYAGMVMISDAIDTAMTALNGTRLGVSRRNSAQPGIPRSRENAYQVRDALVSPAAPQNSCPTVQMIRTSFAADEVKPFSITGMAPPPALLIASTLVAANSRASSTAQPAIAE